MSEISKTQPEKRKIDWLGALAEMAKGLPGGHFLVAPVLRLYDEEKRAEFNNRVRQLLGDSKSIGEGTLHEVMNLQQQTEEVKRVMLTLTPLLNELVQSDREQRERKSAEQALRSSPSISRFPIPLPRGVLKEELQSLFTGDLEPFEGALHLCDYPVPDATSKQQVIFKFVDGLVGEPKERLAQVFTRLRDTKKGSDILKFAAEYLSK